MNKSDEDFARIGRMATALFAALTEAVPGNSRIAHTATPGPRIQVMPTLDDNPALMTAKQVADQLGISRTKVYDLLHSRQLGSVQIGRSRRFRTKDVDAYVAGLAIDLDNI